MVSSFSPTYILSSKGKAAHQQRTDFAHLHQQPKEIIDVEVIPDDDSDDDENTSYVQPSKKKKTNSSPSNNTKLSGKKQVSLLQASLASVEAKLSSLSFNFVDPAPKTSSKQSFIPCRVAFTVEHDDVEYVLGTPTDTQVAIYVEDTNSNEAYFLDPDEDDNMEIMERAATVFQSKYEHISLSDLDEDDDEDIDADNNDNNNNNNSGSRKQKLRIRFKRTPRALTVEGDLSMVTGNWKQDTQKQVEEVKDVAKALFENNKVASDDDDDEYFDNFFRNELGANFREEALANAGLDEQAKELMDLFSMPGLGTEQDNDEGIKEIFDEILDGQDDKLAKEELNGLSASETALRLVGFNDENDDGRVYSLVQLLQPMILVAKNHPSLEFDERLLLTEEEAQKIVPILEQQFKAEFEGAGIQIVQ